MSRKMWAAVALVALLGSVTASVLAATGASAASSGPIVTRPAGPRYGAAVVNPLQCSDPSVDLAADSRVAAIARGQSSLVVQRLVFTLPNEASTIVVNAGSTTPPPLVMAYLANRGTLTQVCFFNPPGS